MSWHFHSPLRLVLFFLVYGQSLASKTTAQEHLERGNLLLSKGQLVDALSSYHAAVALDPDNYQLLFRRATVYLALGKSKAALPDLNEVLRIKPDFEAARLQRGGVYLKLGNLSGALSDYRSVSDDSKTREKLKLIDQLINDVEEGTQMVQFGQCDFALQYLDRALVHMVWDGSLYKLRAECYKKTGNVRKAIADLRNLAKIDSDSTEVYLEISKLYYDLGDVEDGLSEIRECLKLNPDHKTCFSFYKKLKKIAKMREQLKASRDGGKWSECLDRAVKILKTEKEIESVRRDVFKYTCTCHREAGSVSEAIADCSTYLYLSEIDDGNVLCERAEAHLLNDAFDEALSDFRTAEKADNDLRCAREGVKKVERMKKRASQRNYYKILGVPKNADKKVIIKAYRKMAQQWHPDNFQDDEEKKNAEKKFIDIAAAKEVLTNKEMREKFDSGIDPLDPESQNEHHHDPFHNFRGFTKADFGEEFTFHF